MGRQREQKLDLEQIKILIATGQKRYVSYKEGAELYALGIHSFMDLAKQAGAVRKINGRCIVNIEVLNKHIEDYYS